MNTGTLHSLYFKTLAEYCRYYDVPEPVIPEIVSELHEGFKALFEVKSISKGKITKQELWEFVEKVSMILSREYGFSLGMEEELKFK